MSWDVDTASEAYGGDSSVYGADGSVYMADDSSAVNVDSSVSSLFREIGNTLIDVTKQGISGAVSTVKTNLANQIMHSPEGQAQIRQYKMQTFIHYLPWILLAGLAWIIGGRYLKA